MKKLPALTSVAVGLSGLAFGTSAAAQSDTLIPVLITVDEQGNGSYSINGALSVPLTGTLLPDPGPGCSACALTYVIPFFSIIPGDVLLSEDGNVESDLIRFNAGLGETFGTLVF